MTTIKLPFPQISLCFAITLTLVSLFNDGDPQVRAAPTKRQVSTVKSTKEPLLTVQEAQLPPPPPPDRGAPGERKGAASRGGYCPVADSRLTALVPSFNSDEDTSVWGLTMAEYPTFWFYVPYSLTPEHPAEFTLKDENNSKIYNTTFTGAGTPPGVIGVRLPSKAAPLEIGKRYHWTFVVRCGKQEGSSSIYVSGWVERKAPNPKLLSQLKVAQPTERTNLYLNHGYWYDALTALAELRRDQPNDAMLAAKWADLLQVIHLNEVISKPIVQCCTSKS